MPSAGGGGGAFSFADDSLAEGAKVTWDGRGESWTFQTIPRLHLMMEGEHAMTFVRNEKMTTIKLKPGDIWFFPVDAHTREVFTTSFSYLAAVFHETMTRFVCVTHVEGGKAAGALRSEWLHWHESRPPMIDETLGLLARTVAAEAGSGKKMAGAAGECLARALWLMIYDWVHHTRAEPAPMGKAHASWQDIDRFLQENYHRPLNRKVASRALGLHPNRISVLCAKFAGKSFRAILEERRLRQATRFLESSEHKIGAIAALCGYVSTTHFSRTFRRTTGLTPGTWRVRHRKVASPGKGRASVRSPTAGGRKFF